MVKIRKKKLHSGWLALLIFMALTDLFLLIRYFVLGKNIALFNPKGAIAQQQLHLMMVIFVILFAIAVPTLFIVYFTAWKYRESNTKLKHTSETSRSKYLVSFMWSLPTVIIFGLGVVMWTATHRLIPQRAIASDAKPIVIQVISMRWKWLFIYPEQNIATVNFVQIPVDTPVVFELTADEAPMSSFWIPNLGGQLYSMTSHVNRLNLISQTIGDYPGSTPEINGSGFAGMKFTTRVSSSEKFDLWVQDVRQSTEVLNIANYDKLLEPSEYNPVVFYSAYDNSLYDRVISKYLGSSNDHGHH